VRKTVTPKPSSCIIAHSFGANQERKTTWRRSSESVSQFVVLFAFFCSDLYKYSFKVLQFCQVYVNRVP